jgi:hypothetical protein
MIERPPFSNLLGPLVLFSGIMLGQTLVVLLWTTWARLDFLA